MAIVDGKIRCSHCKEWKGLELFRPSILKRGCGECKPCGHIKKREHYQRNKEKMSASIKRYRESRGPEYAKQIAKKSRENLGPRGLKHHNLRRYGIGIHDYESMLEKQHGKCAICNVEHGKKLFVDHCHNTKKVRGLLCKKCNSGIGLLGDKAQGVANALQYLLKANHIGGVL